VTVYNYKMGDAGRAAELGTWNDIKRALSASADGLATWTVGRVLPMYEKAVAEREASVLIGELLR
jgi:hypothetical protein